MRADWLKVDWAGPLTLGPPDPPWIDITPLVVGGPIITPGRLAPFPVGPLPLTLRPEIVEGIERSGRPVALFVGDRPEDQACAEALNDRARVARQHRGSGGPARDGA